MQKVKLLLILLFGAATAFAAPKTKVVKTVLRSWQLPSATGIADTIPFQDTLMLNYPMRDVENNYSLSSAYNGNCLVSPLEARVYFDRLETVDDVFAKAYQPYVYTPRTIRFFNTTTPYSEIAYKKGFTTYREENEINFLFTGNINRRFNLGAQMNYLNAVGHYANQAGQVFNGSVWGSYNGNHYTMQAAFGWSKLSHYDNGGIHNTDDLGGQLEPEDIPVNLNAMVGYRYLTGFLNHYYSITVERPYHDTIEVVNEQGQREKKDTVKINYIPVTTFRHVFETTNSNRRYVEKTAQQGFYGEQQFAGLPYYRNPNQTNDSTDVLSIRNTLSVTFEEEFNRILKFGATVYVMNECQRYLFRSADAGYEFPISLTGIADAMPSMPAGAQQVGDTTYRYQWTNNTFVGGALYKNRGKWVHYGFDGDVCVVGYKLGEFRVNGHVDGYFPIGKDTMYINARAFVKNETPSPYLLQYQSNHFQWDNDFQKTYRFYVGGDIAYPTRWVKPKVEIGFENLTRYIYFDAADGLPKQYEGNIQVLMANVQCHITTPWVNLENHVVYQMSSSEYMPLPTLTLYHNLYYHGSWARKALDAQIGVDLRYFTKYNAPILNPATSQFCVQTGEQKIAVGNYPVLNVYANFYVRSLHLRLFAQYTHFNKLFMKDKPYYYAMPSYPMNPDVFRAGLAWHFYN